jgi:hypothetical protein
VRRALALLTVVLLGAPAAAWAHPDDLGDGDHDGLLDGWDNCPAHYNPSQRDHDADAVPTFTLAERELPNGVRAGGSWYGWTDGAALAGGEPDPRNRPYGAGGDACDEDDDNDGVPDRAEAGRARDVCPRAFDPEQRDSDGDGIGDVCDDTPLGAPAVADHVAPALRIGVPRGARVRELRYGLAAAVRCSEHCTLAGALLAGPRVLGRGRARLDAAGRTFLFVRLTPAGVRHVRRGGAVRARLRITALDGAGNRAVRTRRVVLRP